MSLSAKVCLVTGGGSGIGAEICRRFAAEGATLLIADCRADRGGSVAREMGAAFVEADVASAADAQRMVAAAVDRFGRLDVLVNNAGAPQTPASVVDTSEQEFDRLMAVNAKAIFLAARHA